MKIYIVIIIISILFATTCTDKTNNRECVIYRTNIDLSHESFTHLLSDESNHYLFGELEKDIRDFRTNEITIDQARVGEEKNWASFSRNIPGVCQAVCQTKRSIYLVSRQYRVKNGNPEYSKHKLYKISKEGGGIVELYEWDKGNLIFGGLHFYSDEIGYVSFFSHYNSLRQLITTNDGGKNWKILNLKSTIGTPKYLSNRIYFTSSKNTINSIDKKGIELDSIQVDQHITDFSVETNSDYWLLGKDGDRTVLQHYHDGKTKDIRTFSESSEYFPSRLYKNNDVIVVITDYIDQNLLFGFGGTKPEMYLSKDNGLTWFSQSLKEVFSLEPVSFYKDERITAYAGLGKVLSCSLK